MNIAIYIQNKTNLNIESIISTLNLLNAGATIPFIARYRKEKTNNLNEIQIALIQNEANNFNDIEKRKTYILKSILKKNKLSTVLKARIDECWDLYKLEDLYLPYKTKRISKGQKAKNAGLTSLAKIIMKQDNVNPLQSSKRFLTAEYHTYELVIEGAQHIIAEWINENQIVREKLRKSFIEHGQIITKEIKSKKKLSEIQKKEKLKFKEILEITQLIKNCPSYRILAILRAERKGYIRIKIESNQDYSIQWLERFYCKNNNDKTDYVKQAIKNAYIRLLQPSLENETKQLYKSKADSKSITTFSKNLETLLLAPPIGSKSILALDPGFRSGCKLVCIDKSGKLLYNSIIFPHAPKKNTKKSKEEIETVIKKYKIEVIAIGDGTAGRETEEWIKTLLLNKKIKIFNVREDGASIYSASKIAQEEFPDQDITVRGAVSIGRRLADPLAELVKIEPKSLGIGQYQHDVNQLQLKTSLDLVVESCVNKVGVNVNTASKYLLSYISGLGPKLAESIVKYREENGLIKSREELKRIPKMGNKSFEQCAGFLRIPNSENPLDNSSVHPENYKLIKLITKDLKINISDIISNTKILNSITTQKYVNKDLGLFTLNDIILELKKPGIDPRQENTTFKFSQNIKSIDNLIVGMTINGIITNVTEFGAFVNLGIKENGLIHKTQLSNEHVDNPSDFIEIGQKVRAKIKEVDIERKRISLSLRI